jgi:hypothetical protein
MKDGNIVLNVDGTVMDDKELDFLSELENDVSVSWSEIAKRVNDENRKKEKKKLTENKSKIDFPDFDHFYSLLIDIIQARDIPKDRSDINYSIRELIARIFRYRNTSSKMPKGFNKLWSMFCNPREYDSVNGTPCSYCGNRWDIFYKQKELERRDFMTIDRWEETYTFKEERVMCPTCGNTIIVFRDCEVLGIVKS